MARKCCFFLHQMHGSKLGLEMVEVMSQPRLFRYAAAPNCRTGCEKNGNKIPAHRCCRMELSPEIKELREYEYDGGRRGMEKRSTDF